MGQKYRVHARQAEVNLTAAVEAGRVPEAQWVWKAEGISYVNARRLDFLPASVSPGKTMADFRAWMEAFACEDCHRSGAATRQCANCSVLLCKNCGDRCASEEVDCSFALCEEACFDHIEVIYYWAENERSDAPIFLTPSCALCPSGILCCEMHAETGIFVCSGCTIMRCSEHRLFDRGISICNTCDEQTAPAPAAAPPARLSACAKTATSRRATAVRCVRRGAAGTAVGPCPWATRAWRRRTRARGRRGTSERMGRGWRTVAFRV